MKCAHTVLGPYLFGWGLVAFLLQKEIWVLEHEFKHMPPLIFISWLVYRLWGAKMAKSFETEINEELDGARETIVESKVANMNAIEVSTLSSRIGACTGLRQNSWVADRGSRRLCI